jgi:ABC-type transport system substrate-binding protein
MKTISQEVVAFTSTFVSGDWEIVFIGSFFRTADPGDEYHFMHSKSAAEDVPIKLNFPRHRSEVVDAALDAGRATTDLAERQEAYAQVWRTYAEELPYLFLYHTRTAAVSRPEVHGLGDWTAPDGAVIPAVNGSAQWVTRAWLEP